MRAGRDGHANLQVPVDERVVAILWSLDRELSDRGPVEQQLDLVRLRVLQPVNIAGIATRQVDLDVVLAVLRERVGKEHAAARADGKSCNLPFLRDIGRDANDVALQRALRAPDCQRADLLRSRNVSVEKSRGQVADGHVVEAMTAFIGGQERCGVDVDGQEISDCVLILGTIETPQRFGAAWIRLRGGGFVERRFQPLQQRPAIFRRGLRHVGRRHHARTKFPYDLLPDLSALAWAGDIGFVQLQIGCREPLVVAGDAVTIEHPTVARCRGTDWRR